MKRLIALFFLLPGMFVWCQQLLFEKNVSSPDGKISIIFSLEKNGIPFYKVKHSGNEVIAKSRLGFILKDQVSLDQNFKLQGIAITSFDETWIPVAGTSSSVRNNYNQLSVELKQLETDQRMTLLLRAFNDGVAFRYVVPEQANLKNVQILDELTEFRFNENHFGWWIPNDYSWDENYYKKNTLEDIQAVNTPTTIETLNGLYLSINEAALINYPAMTLEKIPDDKYSFHSVLVPWPDGVRVKTSVPFQSPWRTIHIAETPGGLIESHLAENLNEPCKIENTFWIKPIKFIGIWWGMHTQRWTWEMSPKHGANTKNTKRYINFAARHNIDGVLIEGWNQGWETWKAGMESKQYYTKPYPDFDIDEVSRYAKEKGVQIIGHHETGGNVTNYESQLDTSFQYLKKYGINYLKTGYAGGDFPVGKHHFGQYGVNHYNNVIKKAAEYHIMLDVHEPIKPTGINRTYPNLMTQEGARGNEQNSPTGNHIPPEHHTIIPFTRLLTGGYDYTPGIFQLKNDEAPVYHLSITLAKELALYIVIFSPMLMIADMIEYLEDQPAFKFIQEVPVTWDETKVIDAKIGDFVTIARRKGNEWFIGSVSDENSRTVKIPLNFLEAGKFYIAELYTDGKETNWNETPAIIEIDSCIVNNQNTFNLSLSAAGGAAIRIRPVNNESISAYKTIDEINSRSAEKEKIFALLPVYGKLKTSNNIALDAAVDYANEPSMKYSAGGNKALVDGYLATVIAYDNWQGFEEDNLDIIIDLGGQKRINKVSLNFLLNYNDWVFVPEKTILSFSNDKKNFGNEYVFNFKNDSGIKEKQIKTFSIDNINDEYRYIKVVAENVIRCPQWHPAAGGKAWLFIDEVIVE